MDEAQFEKSPIYFYRPLMPKRSFETSIIQGEMQLHQVTLRGGLAVLCATTVPQPLSARWFKGAPYATGRAMAMAGGHRSFKIHKLSMDNPPLLDMTYAKVY